MTNNNQANDTTNTALPLHLVLRQRREELGLRQADIAEVLRITAESVTQWERGRRRMELDKLPRIAEILKLSARDICERALAEFHPRFYAALFGAANAA